MSFWSSIWDTIWWFLTIFIFIAYLFAIFAIIGDLFRDRKLGGFAKAVWLVFLVFIPFLTALVYLIARGGGMAERSAQAQRAARDATDEYIRSVAGASPTEQIAQARDLLDRGAITPDEYAALKSKALG
ncbi:MULTISPECIES: SHOCT domain-containing protein [unclassified Microbacterium]|uniref:SHOCT domain-containing protein n=1 Tax=unclassified Microbacterium TaxID=2609290 RepID=UPI003018436E